MGTEAKAKGRKIKIKDFDKSKKTISTFKVPFKQRLKFLFSGYLEVETPAVLNVEQYPVMIRFIKAKKGGAKHGKN